MKTNQVGVKIGMESGTVVNLRPFVASAEHDVKSAAGRLFREESVNSVCVYSGDGSVALYLRKTADGVIRESN